MGNIRNQTVNGLKWSALERISVQGVQFLIGIILARLLPPSDFGIIAMLTVFLAVSQTIIDGGFSNALIRKVDRNETDYSTTFVFNIILGFILCLLVVLAAPYIADFYDMPQLSSVMQVLSLTLLINSFSVVFYAILTINIDFRAIAIANFVSAIVSGAVGIAMAYRGWGVWSLVYQSLSRSLLNALIVAGLSKWKPRLLFSKSSFVDLFSYGSKILASSLLNTIYSNLTPMIIGKFYSSKDLGYYDRGRQFGVLPITYIVQTFERVTFPIMSQLQNDDASLIDVYRKYVKSASIVMFFVVMLIIVLAKPLILIILTEKWFEAIIYLQLFCMAEMFNHVTRLNLILLQVKGRSDLYLRLEIIKKTISLVMLLIAAPYGIIAICISQIIYSQAAMYINTYYTKKLFGLSYLMQVRDFVKYLLFAIVACVPAYLFVLLGISNWACVIVGFIVAVFLYSKVLLWNDVIFREMRTSFLMQFKKFI
ncbi:MAG: lipopolysaccharide biosynthesis protein [Prevotella sp.]|nr:lipopolysaccharide biosynthesis protein [Prevotella sp.]